MISLPPEISQFIERHSIRTIAGSPLLDWSGPENCVFLAGSGRSGATWAGHLINYDHFYRYVFEPFNPRYVPAAAALRYRHYLRPYETKSKYLKPVHAILSGRLKSKWTDKFNHRLLSRHRLVKEIRANHMLKWLRVQFPEMPIILVVRHPCAVAHSKIQLNWHTQLDEFLDQPELMKDWLEPFLQEMMSARTDIERHVFMWCIENYVPLKQLERDEYHLIFYEHLWTQPATEAARLFDYLHRDYDPEAFLAAVNRPTSMVRANTTVSRDDNPATSWMGYLSRTEIEQAMRVVELFGMDTIYGPGPMPKAHPDRMRLPL
ncbi:MAG: sulfotransferase domain-containing protein [Verrucomicrobia bacterium]|nr:sulfotransferase domain-containing protein [Verrucomicrobiota bacterium]